MEAPPVQEEFLISLKFQNNLPNAPSGPFLKNINILQSLEEFPEFRTSTLEKGYVWQPHFGLDLGVKLDLVDQDAILYNEKVPVLDQSDLKYLSGAGDKNRGKTKQIDQSSKPWWLRNTTYMENNLYNVGRVKAIAAESSKEVSAKRKADVDYNVDMFSTRFINDSFDLTAKTVAGLVAKNAKSKVVREMPVVPMDYSDLDVIQFFAKKHSLVRFDEDPTVASTGTGADEGYSSSSSTAATPANKKRKVDAGLITNLRQTVKSEELKNAVNLEVSLVSPLVSTTSEVAANESMYSWVKDYRMDVAHSQLCDSFLFVYKNSSEGGNAGSVQYFPIQARVDMKKMNPEESLPHECIVIKE